MNGNAEDCPKIAKCPFWYDFAFIMQKLPFCYIRAIVLPFVGVVTRLVLINCDSVGSIIVTRNSAIRNLVVGAGSEVAIVSEAAPHSKVTVTR